MTITDDTQKLYAISGQAQSYAGEDSELLTYISKYGRSKVFGPVVEKGLGPSGVVYLNLYSFSFMAEKPTNKQMEYLDRHTVSAAFEHLIIEECRA